MKSRLRKLIFFLIGAVVLCACIFYYQNTILVQYVHAIYGSEDEVSDLKEIYEYHGALDLFESLEIEKIISGRKAAKNIECKRSVTSWYFKKRNDDLVIIQENGCMLYNNHGFEIDSSSLERIKELIKSKVDNDELISIR